MSSSTRRDFLKSSTAAAAALALAGRSDASAQDAPTRKPNLVFVFADEHRECSWSHGRLRDEVDFHTPHLEHLAETGVTCTHSISNNPVCSPYRASLMTGQHSQTNEIMLNVDPGSPPLSADATTIARILKDEGYATGYVGKWHLYPGTFDPIVVPPEYRYGFDDLFGICFQVWNTQSTQTFEDEEKGTLRTLEGYAPIAQMDMALDFIRGHQEDPFCIFLSWQPPHYPYAGAPDDFLELYDPDKIGIRPNVPQHMRDVPEYREMLQGYYAHISALDHEVGRLTQELEKLGLRDDTIVVYTSDHGDMMGASGYWGKILPQDESINTPFILSWPGGVPSGVQYPTLFSCVDIAPTLLGLMGVSVPGSMEGVDHSPAFRGEHQVSNPEVLLTGDGETATPVMPELNWWRGRWRGLRTQQYTYVRRLRYPYAQYGPSIPWFLYDNIRDPYQMENLVIRASHSEIRAELDRSLYAWMRRLGDVWLEVEAELR